MSDNHQALRSALAEMCKQAAMHNTKWTSEIGETNEWGTQCYEIHGERVQELATAYGESTAAYIAACNPIAIAAILSELDALRKDAERYRWLRDNTDSDWAICEWNTDESDGVGYYRDARAPNIVDAAIDAAKEQA